MMDRVERLVILLLCLILVSTSLEVVRVASQAEEREIIEATWTPPPIQRCDKEIWDRIREGCDNERMD